MRRRQYATGRLPAPQRPQAGGHWFHPEEVMLDGTTMIDPVVFEAEPAGWFETGLLDPYGAPILACETPKDPIGFLWHDESGALRPRDEFLYGPEDGPSDDGSDDLWGDEDAVD